MLPRWDLDPTSKRFEHCVSPLISFPGPTTQRSRLFIPTLRTKLLTHSHRPHMLANKSGNVFSSSTVWKSFRKVGGIHQWSHAVLGFPSERVLSYWLGFLILYGTIQAFCLRVSFGSWRFKSFTHFFYVIQSIGIQNIVLARGGGARH